MALLAKIEEMLVNVKDLKEVNVSDQMMLMKNMTILINDFLRNDSGNTQQLKELIGNESNQMMALNAEGMGSDGSLELSARAQAVLISIYGLTTIFSSCGNILVILVLILGCTLKTELSVFIMNLAVADLLMAFFCMPFTFTQVMLGRWVWGIVMCPLVLFMQVTSVSVSIFTNVAIGVDRFWGVMYPLKQKLTRNKAKLIVAMIWIASFAIAGPQLFVGRVKLFSHAGNILHECNERWSSKKMRYAYSICLSCLTYVLPLLLLAFTYYKIGAKLFVRRTPGNRGPAHKHRDRLMKKSKRKVLKMALLVVVMFAVCWLPINLFVLVLDFNPHLLDYIKSLREEQIFVAIFYVCHWLAMANSFANPVIFTFLHDNFRKDLRKMFAWLPCVEVVPQVSGSELRRCETIRCSVRSLRPRSGTPYCGDLVSRRNRLGSEGSVTLSSTSSYPCKFEDGRGRNRFFVEDTSNKNFADACDMAKERRRHSLPPESPSGRSVLGVPGNVTNKCVTEAIVHLPTAKRRNETDAIKRDRPFSLKEGKLALPAVQEIEDCPRRDMLSAGGDTDARQNEQKEDNRKKAFGKDKCTASRETSIGDNTDNERVFFWSAVRSGSEISTNDQWDEDEDPDETFPVFQVTEYLS